MSGWRAAAAAAAAVITERTCPRAAESGSGHWAELTQRTVMALRLITATTDSLIPR